MATARITSKGQITIPKVIREQLGVRPGDSLEFQIEDGHVEVRPVRRRSITELRGLFDVKQSPAFAGQEPPPFSWEEEREIAWREATRRLWDHE